MNYVLYLIIFFLIFSVVIGFKKLYRYHADKNLLESIDEKTKRKIIDNQTITVIDRKSGYGYLKYNCFEIFKIVLIWVFFSFILCLVYFITGYVNNNKIVFFLWLLLPGVIIFLYFFLKDILRIYLCKKVCIINAFCCEVRLISSRYGSSKEVSIVYYDYKKSKLVIKSIILNIGNDDLDYNSFCEIIVGERKKRLNIIDVLPKNNK